MSSKILINAIDSDECRIAKVIDNKLEEFHIETTSRIMIRGNIYKAVVTRIEPSLQAVFVDFGGERNGFLQKQEIHHDYFQDSESGDRSIASLVKRGQELLVQVTKEPTGNKGAMLTTYISLPGRFLVLMPGSTTIGVSRKIEKEEERKRLKDIIEKLKMPEGFGLIVRTVGEAMTKTTISRDLRALMRQWKNIKTQGMKTPAPCLLYKDRSLAVRAMRDTLTQDISGVLIDNEEIYHEIRDFMTVIAPKQVSMVKLHKGPKPIFTKYELENQIASIFESRVELKSGGSVVIEQTEALVSIDVNSGRATQQKSIEQTALQTNLEAAEEIARQLRLRDMGGLIVIDFIDMREAKHRAEVEKALKAHFKLDKARVKIGRITRFGLLELSRQRMRGAIDIGTHIACPHCKGRGRLPSVERLGISFLRQLSLETSKDGLIAVKASVPVQVADFLLNQKRREIMDLETRRGLSIYIQGDTSLMPGTHQITCEKAKDAAG